MKNLIEKNESEFKPIFGNWKKILEMLDTLAGMRDLVMHSEKNVQPYQKQLSLGICGMLLQIIKNWEAGYSRKVTSWECDFRFEESEKIGEQNAKTNVTQAVKQWVDWVKTKANGTIKEIKENTTQTLTIPMQGGSLTVEVKNFTRQNYSELGVFQAVNVHVSTNNYEKLIQLLEESPQKYWTFSWVMSHNDEKSIVESVNDVRRSQPSGGTTTVDGKIIGRSGEYYLENNQNRIVRVDLAGSDSVSKITLVRDRGGPNGGFTGAHNVFNPDLILSALYGEIPQQDIRRLVDDACN